MENVKLNKGKRLVLRYMHITFNRYEEFFHNHLSDHSIKDIDDTLKGLKRELTWNNKLKGKALRKEFEKREGISRRKRLTLLTLGLLAGTLALSYYHFIYLPEQRRAPYRKYGTSKQIDEFLSKYPQANGNSTWIDFFKQ